MRVLTLVTALMATPAFVAMSQDPGQAAGNAAAAGKCATADDRRSSNSWENNRPATDPKDRDRVGCSPVAPPVAAPPPAPVVGAAIVGRVFDFNTNPLANWTVTLTGTVAASAVTDATGSFAFRGLQAGTYTLCEVWQDPWIQYWPRSGTACKTGIGYTLIISESQVTAQAGFIFYFGNVVP